MAFTNQQILDQLYSIRDEFLFSGNLLKKNITTPDGSTIFYRDLDDLNGYITTYSELVAAENATTKANSNPFIKRIGFYA